MFPGTLPVPGWETGWQVWSTGKGTDLRVAGRASSSTDTTPGTLWSRPDMSRVGPVAPREACAGAACPEPAGSRVLARNRPAAARPKPSPGGLPPVLRSGAVGTEGSAPFQPLSPVTRSPAPEFQAPRRQRASHHGKQVSRGAQGTAWALSRRETVPVPRESPGESPRPGRRGCHCLPGLLPWGLALLARGPGSPQVNASCGRQGQEAADSLTEVGVGALGD